MPSLAQAVLFELLKEFFFVAIVMFCYLYIAIYGKELLLHPAHLVAVNIRYHCPAPPKLVQRVWAKTISLLGTINRRLHTLCMATLVIACFAAAIFTGTLFGVFT